MLARTGLTCLVSLLAISNASTRAAELPSPKELLEASIAFHDPEGVWGTRYLEFAFEESRPDGATRNTVVAIDLEREFFAWESTRDGRTLSGVLAGDRCELRLDGRDQLSEAEREEHRLSCERLEWFRNYYTYLWGLPMKLRDPGTRLGSMVTETDFEGRSVLAIKVTYDQDVGGDTWYFYFDPSTSALTGYRFFHDESQNDGEYITLDGLATGAGLQLPRARAWYTHQGNEHLGTDMLTSLESSGDEPSRQP